MSRRPHITGDVPQYAAPESPGALRAILAPTNTGKTHFAIERMLARTSGVIGLPLRLLAREIYDKICAIKGEKLCALITGEEKIIPPHAAYYVCTVEAMPTTKRFAFVAIDEVQLMAHPERGHIFTDRVLYMRGMEETLLLGAETCRDILSALLPDVRFETRERFSTLSYSGPKKITRLPKRSVVVAFSAAEVYAIAELIRRYRGGAAIVMGALSPRTRNAQAALYQSGEVDFLVATDAIGMGLNLDADHVAFASVRKFDGRRRRQLNPMEVGQIAGRAGRFRNDGTFGPTGDCPPFEDQLVARIENHYYNPLRGAEWRNGNLNLSSLHALAESLALPTPHKRLRRIAEAEDEASLARFARMPDVEAEAESAQMTRLVWEVCQVPDFRNSTIDTHVQLLRDIFEQLSTKSGTLTAEFLHKQTSGLDHTEGGVDILATRLAYIRTWTFCAHKPDWTDDTAYWVDKTREIEDRLSDALHEKLTAKFVDKRTRALLRGNKAFMEATIKDDGDVWVEEHKIGRLTGLQFELDESQSELEAKTLREAAEQAVAPEVNRRLTSIVGGTHAIFTLSEQGEILWGGAAVGKISRAGSVQNPDVNLIGGELGQDNIRAMAEERMRDFLRAEVRDKLAPLNAIKELSNNPETDAEVRGFAYSLYENFGHLDRSKHWRMVNDLSQAARKPFRELGVTFGQYDVYMREMIRPKPSSLLNNLLAFGAGGDSKPFIPFAGVTSLANEGDLAASGFMQESIFRAGYKACGPRIIRFDILNRLAGLIRQAQRESGTRRFQIMQEMLALLGCTFDEMRGVLEALGYQSQKMDSGDTEGLRPELSAPVSDRFMSDTRPPSKARKQPEQKAEPVTPTPKAETPAETVEAAKPSAETPVTAPPSESATPEQAAATPEAPKPTSRKSSKKPEPRALSVYNFRTTHEDGTITEEDNTEFWFLPFKPKKNRQHGSDNKGQNNQGQRSYRKAKQPRQKSSSERPAKYGKSEPRKIEDSPFAALAALKKDLPKK